MKTKKHLKLTSMVMTCLVLLTMSPLDIFSQEVENSQILTCHTEHTDCSYTEEIIGVSCSHINEEGYSCNLEALEDYVCQHLDDCGYIESKEAIDCNHSCEICSEDEICICLTKCSVESENEEMGVINQECPVCSKENLDIANCQGENLMLLRQSNTIAQRTITLDLEGTIVNGAGNEITSEDGIFDMLETEGWKWNKNTKILTLNGVDIETTDKSAMLLPDGTTIVLEGENKVIVEKNSQSVVALVCKGDITIKGSGSLSVTNAGYAAIRSEKSVTIEGGNIELTSNEANGIFATEEFKVTGGSIIAEGKGNAPGIWSIKDINISAGSVEASSENSNGMGTDASLFISGNSTIKANGKYPGLYSVEKMSISGESKINAIATEETGIFSQANIEISDSADVTATGNKYCGIKSNTDIIITGGKVEANAPNETAIYAVNSITISGSSEVNAEGELRGLQSNNITISGSPNINATSKSDVAIAGANDVSITEDANVIANGKQMGIYTFGDFVLSAKNIEAYCEDNYAVCQGKDGKNIIIGGKLVAESKDVSAIYSQGNITIGPNADITATGGWCGIQAVDDINIEKSKIEAIGNDDDAIFSEGSINIDGGSIHAKAATGHAAIRAKNIKLADEIAQGKISLENLVGKNGAKLAFSDWNNLNEEEVSWTTFIAKDQNELIINDEGGAVNRLEEVWLGEPYEVVFDVNGGSGTDSKEYVYPNDKVTPPTSPSKDNAHFNGWYINDVKFDIENTEITSDITLKANFDNQLAQHIFGQWIITKPATSSEKGSQERTCTICPYKQTEEIPKLNSPGGGGGGNVQKPQIPVTGEIVTESTTDENGNTKVEITENLVKNALEEAKKQAQKQGKTPGEITAIINIKSQTQNASSVSVNLPLNTQKAVIEDNIANLQLVIENPDIVLGMDLKAITAINKEANQDVKLTATRIEKSNLSPEAQNIVKDRPAFDITAQAKDGKTITNLGNGKIKIQLPYTLKPEETKDSITGIYINDKGEVEYLKDTYYDTAQKSQIITTNHLSIYAIATKTGYQDIIGHWAKPYIDQITKQNLIEGITDISFDPDSYITRETFVTALGKLQQIDEKSYKNTKFIDLGQSKNQGYITWAKENQIIVGTSENTFDPTRAITREEIATIIVNYKKAKGEEIVKVKEQTSFADHNQIENWAEENVQTIFQGGIMVGKENNNFDPKGNTTRAEGCVILSKLM